MEEINRLTQNDSIALLKTVEDNCAIIIPDEKERLGEISFHLYQYNCADNCDNFGKTSWTFQIRYGIHPVFTKKHIKILTGQNQIEILSKIICENKNVIYTAIIEYCQNQMDTMVSMELEPEFNRRFSYIFNYDLKLCKSRKKNKLMLKAGWPSLCIAISWNDEFNEFQEFMYPLMIDPESKKFNLHPGTILTAFQKYHDAII